MKIVLFNVKFSANVGDGVIAECLEGTIRNLRPSATVTSIDMAGRTRYGGGTVRNRAIILRVLEALPVLVRNAIVRFRLRLVLSRLSPDWLVQIRSADLAVIGGGNLLQDDNLNFPLKVAAVLDLCCKAGVPVALFAVGVSKIWSAEAMRLFGQLSLNEVVDVCVRDVESQEAWRSHFAGDFEPVEVCPDPGILAAGIFATIPRIQHGRKLVAIGVTHPAVLQHHSDASLHLIPGANSRWFADLALQLCERNHDVLFFTNGAEEDQVQLRKVMTDARIAILIEKKRITAAEAPATPADLAAIIQSSDGVVAHRLHANILAYAFGKPHVGLHWDMKIGSFLRSVGREKYLVYDADMSPSFIADLFVSALDDGIDESKRVASVDQARASIGDLIDKVDLRETTAARSLRRPLRKTTKSKSSNTKSV